MCKAPAMHHIYFILLVHGSFVSCNFAVPRSSTGSPAVVDRASGDKHAESIAFYNGERQEASCASLRLALLVAVVRIRIVWTTFLALWTNFYQHATYLLPSILTAPRYFAGEVEFGVITQARDVHAAADRAEWKHRIGWAAIYQP